MKDFANRILDSLFSRFLSERTKSRIEVIILLIAIASFFIHLILITFVDAGFVHVDDHAKLFTNPIAAIYTPFSFILIYEVYLLIYYLPKSITVYIGKQYEIMTLVLIRRLFKDFSELKLTSDWFSVKGDLVFTYDLVTTLILFFLISVFYSLNPQKDEKSSLKPELSEGMTLFIRSKNWIATLLVPVFVITAAYSLFEWVHLSFFQTKSAAETAPPIDGIFFDQFFTILILADVLLLLISFLRTDRFSTVIRNSGFIISTILIKVSFGTEGLLNNILVVVAVFFGVTILAIQKRYERLGLSS